MAYTILSFTWQHGKACAVERRAMRSSHGGQ